MDKENDSLSLHILNAVRQYVALNQESKPKFEEIIGVLETAKLILFTVVAYDAQPEIDNSQLKDLRRILKNIEENLM